MRQVVKKTEKKSTKKVSSKPKTVKKQKVKKTVNVIKDFGTSKLEVYFAEKYLIPNKIDFVYQFKSDIGRYYDFAIVKNVLNPKKVTTCGIEHIEYFEGMDIDLIIEVDGDYYHSNPDKYSEDKLNKLQLRNKRIDEQKNEWAMLNGIPLLRLWESDIKGNRKKVIEELSKYIRIEKRKK